MGIPGKAPICAAIKTHPHTYTLLYTHMQKHTQAFQAELQSAQQRSNQFEDTVNVLTTENGNLRQTLAEREQQVAELGGKHQVWKAFTFESTNHVFCCDRRSFYTNKLREGEERKRERERERERGNEEAPVKLMASCLDSYTVVYPQRGWCVCV
jgi:hypothetical protein